MRASRLVILGLTALHFAAPLQAQTRQVIAFGDSLSIGLREPGVDCDIPSTARGYAEHLQDFLVARGVDTVVGTSGVCGEKTMEAVTRVEQVILQRPADAYVIMEGTNDISEGNPAIPISMVVFNLGKIYEKVAAAGIEPVLSSIIPYGPTVDGMNRNGRATALTEEIQRIASDNGYAFADAFRFMFDIPDVFDTLYAEDDFHLNSAGYERLAEVYVDPVLQAFGQACVPTTPCVASDTVHCLLDGRYEVNVDWVTANDSGAGKTIPISSDTGQFYFFSPVNIELVVKVLDGSCFNDNVWVFYGALSDVEYALRVTDRETCQRRIYFNPQGTLASIGDTSAFPGDDSGCPDEDGQ